MGMFDTFIDEERGVEEQTKCFGNLMKVYLVGNQVRDLEGNENYYIKCRYSLGYILVENNIFKGIVNKTKDYPVFDKYGDEYDANSKGLVGEPYQIKPKIIEEKNRGVRYSDMLPPNYIVPTCLGLTFVFLGAVIGVKENSVWGILLFFLGISIVLYDRISVEHKMMRMRL